MAPNQPILDEIALFVPRLRSLGVKKLSVFGSFARGTQQQHSDLDLLIDLEPGRSLLDIVAIQQDIEDALGIRVDVVTERSLSPHIRDSIIKDAVPL